VTLQRIVSFFTILIVVLVVAAAFMVLGPPSRQRAEALDQQRIEDLQHVEESLNADYETDKHPLPSKLPEPRHDPVSGAPYQYRRLDAHRYMLCARFESPSPSTGDRTLDDKPFWRHGAGQTCYTFDVRRERME
jgi:hypothetical protein